MNKRYTAIAGIILASGLQQPVHGKEAEQNPYLAIVKRNAFELTDTPPSTQQKTLEPLKASDIKLTGIFLRNGVERAAIALIEKYDPVKPRDLARWLAYVGMSEDEFERIADTFRDDRVRSDEGHMAFSL